MYRWTGWNEANTAELRTRWLAGESGELIAEHLGAPSRSAVIGKAWRMGLAERTTYQRKPTPKREIRHAVRIEPTKARSLSFVPIPAEPLPLPEITDVAVVSHNKLEADTCRWVCATDTPNNDTPKYCGCKQMLGKPYCEAHTRRAYQPDTARPKIVAKANKVRAMAENSLGKLNGDLKRLLALA